MERLHDRDIQQLGSTFLQTSWHFQAILTGPIAAALAISAFVRLLNTHGPVYDIVTQLCTSILLSGIVFIVLVQQKLPKENPSKVLTLRFEVAKSILATVLWSWLMMDAVFGPESWEDYYKRQTRILSASAALIVLLVLFYPTAYYAWNDARRDSVPIDDDEYSELLERIPLLRG